MQLFSGFVNGNASSQMILIPVPTYNFCTLVEANWQNWLCVTSRDDTRDWTPLHFSWSSCGGPLLPGLLLALEEEGHCWIVMHSSKFFTQLHWRKTSTTGAPIEQEAQQVWTPPGLSDENSQHAHTCACLDSISPWPHHHRPFFSLTPNNL